MADNDNEDFPFLPGLAPPQETLPALVPALPAANPAHRPSGYDFDLVDQLCHELANGTLLETLLQTDPRFKGVVSRATLYRWRRQHKEFDRLFTEAMESQVEYLLDEAVIVARDASNDLIEIADAEGAKIVTLNKEVIDRTKIRINTNLRLVPIKAKVASRALYQAPALPERKPDETTSALSGDGAKVIDGELLAPPEEIVLTDARQAWLDAAAKADANKKEGAK